MDIMGDVSYDWIISFSQMLVPDIMLLSICKPILAQPRD